MLAGLNIQPGGWGKAPGEVHDIRMYDLQMDSLASVMMLDLGPGNSGSNVSLERVKATRVNCTGISIENWGGGSYTGISLEDVDIEFVGNPDPTLPERSLWDANDPRPLPVWGLWVSDVDELRMRGCRFSLIGEDSREPERIVNVAILDAQ